MYHQLHHGGRLLFHGFRDFYEFSWFERERTPTEKNGGKRGILGTRDADFRKAVFQAI